MDQINATGWLEQMRQRAESQKSQSQAEGRAGLTPDYDCKTCCDSEFIVVKAPVEFTLPNGEINTFDQEYAAPCPACSERKRIARLFKSSRITEEFQQLMFDTFRTQGRPMCVQEAFSAMQDYVSRFDVIGRETQNSAALLGPPGSGKTHLLTAVCNQLLARGVSVHYFPWVEGSNELRGDWVGINSKLEAMKTAQVLYIDDLFKGRKSPTDFQLENLFDVVNYRYLNRLPILLSSEKDFDFICEIDEGIGSRLFERARKHTVIMRLADGESGKLNYRLPSDIHV